MTPQKPHNCPRSSTAERRRRVLYSLQDTGFFDSGRLIAGVKYEFESRLSHHEKAPYSAEGVLARRGDLRLAARHPGPLPRIDGHLRAPPAHRVSGHTGPLCDADHSLIERQVPVRRLSFPHEPHGPFPQLLRILSMCWHDQHPSFHQTPTQLRAIQSGSFSEVGGGVVQGPRRGEGRGAPRRGRGACWWRELI